MMTPQQPAREAPRAPPHDEQRVRVRLTRDRIGLDEGFEAVTHPESGGVGVFAGVVRNHHEGEPVRGITYEAWEERAIADLHAVGTEVLRAFPAVRAVYVAHRIGSLAVGDVSVVVAASAPHRDDALAAARMLIDLVKTAVPIWKHEQLADGTSRWQGS